MKWYDAGLTSCQEALQKFPNSSDLRHLKAKLLWSTGDYKESLKELDICLKAEKRDVDSHFMKALVHESLGEYQLGLDSINKAL